MDEMKKGTIKEIKVNPKKDLAAIQFEDGSMFYVNLGMIKGLMSFYKRGDPIGEVIEYELSEQRIDGDGVIKRFFVKGAIIG